MNPILSIQDVVKMYDSHCAVNHVSIDIPKGIIFGLLGPNGAGKTSLIRMITTITRADSGKILFNGEPLNDKHPEQIGYMPEERGLYKKMKVGEQLLYLARLKSMSKKAAEESVEYMLTRFDMQAWKNKKVEELSKGMQQKIQFIATTIHQPPFVILDEPFSGLDPINSILIQNEIEEMRKKGITILFSTHRMEQVEQFCDRIVLINKGKNILEGDVKEVRQRFKEHKFRIDFEGELPQSIRTNYEIAEETPSQVILQLAQDGNSREILKAFVESQQCNLTGFQEILPSLGEIFIKQVEGHNHG